MRLVLDVENTTTKRNGKTHMDPFEANNFLVQVGTKNVDVPTERHLLTFDHVEYTDRNGGNSRLLQTILDRTTLLIMHNAQHDLMWLWASGFKYDGDIYDTMLAEYILQRGQKQPLSLLALKKDTIQMKYPLKSLHIILAATLTLLPNCSLLLLPKASPKASPTEWIEFETLPSKSVKPLPECTCPGSEWIDSPFK